MTSERELARAARAWPFEEARKLVDRIGDKTPEKGHVLFETGYGPSGLPHIGTFGEVVRTTMVRQAFRRLSDVPSRLFAFSDDMDGLRKVPDNVPNQEMLRTYLGTVGVDGIEHGGLPLTRIPDPFGCHESFGHHNNAQLRKFLDDLGFEYEFQSSTDWYVSGRFDPALQRVLERYDAIMAVMLPSLREERRRSYCPFLPVSPRTGRVLQAPAVEVKKSAGTIVFRDEEGQLFETPVTGGRCKLQWRVDWAMRWYALQVDYEMSGKDLIDSVKLGSQICRALGGNPPEGFNYELFLDEEGQKISKSKGNGLSVEEWLRYAPSESLSLFMYQKPRAAKRLYFDVIPRAVDDYLEFLRKFPAEEPARKLENPVWHIHDGNPPQPEMPFSYGILLNLAAVANAEDPAVLWGFISRYQPDATPERAPMLDRLVRHAIRYYQDFVKPAKRYRAASDMERAALEDLVRTLEALPQGADAETIQTEIYEVGKRHPFPELKAWFSALYEVLLGQPQGPRFGSFVALYGVPETIDLVREALTRSQKSEDRRQ
jgi:lysyl-tRNA synthetase, class I